MASQRSAEERLESCLGAEGFQHSFLRYNQSARRGDLSSDKLVIDNFEVTLVVVATTTAGNRADIYQRPAQWNHLQVRVSVAGRWGHGGVLPARNSIGDWLAGQADLGALAN